MSLPFWLAFPEVSDPIQAEFDSWGIEVQGFLIGKPLSTDPAYTTKNGAIDNYIDHLLEMQTLKGWPPIIVDQWIGIAANAPGANAGQVYTYLLKAETLDLESRELSSAAQKLPNWDKHRNWLAYAAQVGGATDEALKAAGWFAVAKEATKKSVEKPGGIPIWAWVGFAAIGLLAIRK